MRKGFSRLVRVWLLSSVASAAAASAVPAPMCASDTSPGLFDAAFQPSASPLKTEHADAAIAAGCRVAASALIASSAPRLLVDVRSVKEVAVAAIPGAVNLGLESLASHLLVKSSAKVVLVGDGKNTSALLQRCALLRERGLAQIAVLDGGIPAWRRAGGAITGDAAVLDQPLLLSERDLHEVLHQPDALLVLARGRPTPALTTSGARIVAANRNAASPAAVLSRVPMSVAGTAPVVIVLDRDAKPAAWRRAAHELGLPEPLFFVGEPSRYDAYLEQQARIAEAARQPRSAACGKG